MYYRPVPSTFACESLPTGARNLRFARSGGASRLSNFRMRKQATFLRAPAAPAPREPQGSRGLPPGEPAPRRVSGTPETLLAPDPEPPKDDEAAPAVGRGTFLRKRGFSRCARESRRPGAHSPGSRRREETLGTAASRARAHRLPRSLRGSSTPRDRRHGSPEARRAFPARDAFGRGPEKGGSPRAQAAS